MPKQKVSKAFLDFQDSSIDLIKSNIQQSIENNVQILECGKTISIDKIPDCSHKQLLLQIVQDKNSKIVVIAHVNSDNTWTAFAGYPDPRDLKLLLEMINNKLSYDWMWFCENVRDREQVLMMGEKLSEDIAKQLFPDCKIERYKI